MSLSQFLERAFSKGLEFKPPNSMRDQFILRQATQYISFGCDRCNEGRSPNDTFATERRCCTHCYGSFGYLRLLPSHNPLLKIYADAFKKGDGFWTPEGCTLPRYLRSEICVTHYCSTRRKLSSIEVLIIQLIRDSGYQRPSTAAVSFVIEYMKEKGDKQEVKAFVDRVYRY